MEPDFSGYATKAGLKCSDGRTIMPDAFKHQDKMTVPLVWQHGHTSPENVLGHAVLEAREDGVYTYGYFNSTEHGQHAKTLVEHGDVTFLSIYANQLIERAKQVFHGAIREVSLVLAGANPGALIDQVRIAHGDGEIETLEDEAIITTGLAIQHEDKSSSKSGDTEGPTVQEVYDSFTDEQKEVVHTLIGAALQDADGSAEHGDNSSGDNGTGDNASGDNTNEDNLTHTEGTDMTSKRNVFETNGQGSGSEGQHVLTHDAMAGIVADAKKPGQTLKTAVEAYALEHGITNIEELFPEAKNLTDRPEWVTRRMEWVAGVISGTRHTPFSRIKTMTADLTHEEARAKGYIKGNLKKEQFFGVLGRTTTPQTIYKKQKLDRDDIIDITDFDVVVWIKAEMRVMLEEELARAVMIGDGRPVEDPANPGEPNPDKIKDPAGASEGAGIRSILHDHELYVTSINVNLDDADSDYEEVVEEVLLARRFYKGSGNPTFYTTEEVLARMLLSKDGFQRRRYDSEAALTTALRVSKIVPVEVFEDEPDLVGIIVNLSDYAIGADRGGEVTLFDDFDIDYNQYKYLIETRVSGALTKIKSAMVIRKTAAANVEREPVEPAFNQATGVVTIPAVTGVEYRNADTDAVLAAGPQAALAPGTSLDVVAVPTAGSYFATNEDDAWTFTRPVA
jgi:hypothetical protein